MAIMSKAVVPFEGRYARRFMAAMVGYAILLIAAVWLLKRMDEGSLWRYPIALLPLIPVIYGVAAFLAFVRALDELQRQIQLEGLAFSLGCTGLLTLTLGFLENAGFPRLSLVWVLPTSIVFWGLGVYVAGRRYR